jgi:hypothetical protein
MSSSDISNFTNPQDNNDKKEMIYESDVNLNDLLLIVESINACLSRQKINVDEMHNIGLLYNRISSYLKYIELSNKEELDESEEEMITKLLNKVDISDIIISNEFIERMIERELFADEEKVYIDNLHDKLLSNIKKIQDNFKE